MLLTHHGATLFYTTTGRGPDLVFLHAFPSCHEMWLPVANLLSSHFRVTLIDLRGLGQSGLGMDTVSMAQHAADVDRVCREVSMERAVFAGCSIGGYVLFELWRVHRERIKALVLCDTRAAADTAEGRAARLKSVDDVLARGPADFLDVTTTKLLGSTTQRNRRDLVNAARHSMRHSTAAGIAAIQRGMAERPDSTPTLATINVPTLIFFGEEDTITPVAEGQVMASSIRDSRFQVIPRAGHLSPFEQPEEVHRLLRNFLDSL
ncbi:MAG: alpha/beta fold hydrolase [Acidobacteriales bacterium]|nr:alpha/beta fold hydrolase [Terriglobales bacterium]